MVQISNNHGKLRNMEKVAFRPLGKVLNLIQSLGLEINHNYDDLVFVSNSTFIIQFDSKIENKILIHFNKECKYEDSLKIYATIEHYSKKEGLIPEKASIFTMEQIEGKEEIELRFE